MPADVTAAASNHHSDDTYTYCVYCTYIAHYIHYITHTQYITVFEQYVQCCWASCHMAKTNCKENQKPNY